ncbi:phosphoglycerate mutase [Shewanella sp. NFH-SH190041]|uniref:histidine phosphatase family protein n=1 Tax=Shewanella sp. NFH-SH190041 TaxID=2950245 RepID=UPI0021C49761|nr:histidine phosphatase family protein [Shewanella sp. NFH-SH190041]BDM63006.1 phosphoglycerate mutase [Shewanella sp. NFH-SH190041]
MPTISAITNKSIYILRHGQTRFNAEGRLQGHCDSPLTAKGEAQAAAMGQALQAQQLDMSQWQLIASPLGRARQTAAIVASQLGLAADAIQTDARVMECHLGQWEQQEIPPLFAAEPTLQQRGDWYLQAPGAETLQQVQTRLHQWLTDTPASHIILISHGLTGVILRGLLLGLNDSELWQQDKPQDALYYFHGGQLQRISTVDFV